jgi:XTP/dITP diphosphohydrolase
VTDEPGAAPEPLVEFGAVMRRLRAECGWKREQTHRSLARYLLEETHELLEVLDAWEEQPDPGHLREELGDLLLQVYFHAVLAEERGEFTLDDVARGITEKMHRRNPHVFGDSPASDLDATAVNDAWQAIKATERPRASVTDGLPPGLPALLLADKVLDRLSRSGSPVAAADTAGADLGDRLLALVGEAHADGVDPEQSLRDAVRRLVARAEPAAAPQETGQADASV